MDGFRALEASASGLAAERQRMDVIAQNIANANTTRTADGGPYRRQVVLFQPVLDAAGAASGVEVAGVERDASALPTIHQPGHPDADEDGFVALPNVSLPMEMVDLISSSRGYEANLLAAKTYKQMAERAIDIAR